MSARMAEFHARMADRSQAAADAYRELAKLIATDPRFEILAESEVDRMTTEANEYEEDAEHEREQALEHGYKVG